jgi:hypothetical protein
VNRNRPQQQQNTVSKEIGLDCELCGKFLQKASRGISMNRIMIRQPTKLSVSDSCPFRIGGFLLEERTWRMGIPASSPIHGQSMANNFLEFLGMVVKIWLMCLAFPNSQFGVTTCDRRQHIRDWVAIPIEPNLPRVTLLRCTPTECPKVSNASDRLRTLSRLSAHQMQNQLGCRPPLLVGQHQRGSSPLGLQ